ncbi:hypothetical protein [Streptomyces tauricus]|uniref:hypothetical protein n=1 Tax=Streptomyces tauricus TaxID=68274 RepID=UPI002243B3CA|nr:hypothetical protein [Streptomyces tauricus]
MSLAEVTELIHLATRVHLAPDVAKSVHTRTAGNPFFVQELGRLWAADNEVTMETVLDSTDPATVRDVVRDRLVVLDNDTRELLEIAALVGCLLEAARGPHSRPRRPSLTARWCVRPGCLSGPRTHEVWGGRGLGGASGLSVWRAVG